MPPKYQKKDPISHCLDRPDMYIGSTRLRNIDEYIAKQADDGLFRICKQTIKTSPAVLRIFIEILSNALDNATRSKKTKTPCTRIDVTIDPVSGETSIWNDGEVIPIELHETEKVYNHTLVFGHLLTGSNYDDEEERILAGRNGLGATACAIFSTQFTVEGCDPKNKKTLTQTWTNNLRDTDGPTVKPTKETKGYTKVTWFPDFERFELSAYTDDIVNQYTRYVIDAAMLSKVAVTLNGVDIPVNSLSSYANLYIPETTVDATEKLYIKTTDAEVLVMPSLDYQPISFVNGIYTRLGGQHVDAWAEALFRPFVDKFNGKDKEKDKDKKTTKKATAPKINIADVRQFFRLFVVSTVVRPEFNGQDKEKLESPTIAAEVKKTHITAIGKWSVMEDIQNIIRTKELLALKKTEKKKRGTIVTVEGYDPANNAGGKQSKNCSLILCEGLSAKTYAVAGIEKGVFGRSGRDWFGILPLRGKLLNTRNATPTQIAGNKVITDLIQVIGLHYDADYKDPTSFDSLNYGKVILLTDADTDGIHIEGLILNFISSLFPSLLEREVNFLVSMKTPICRVFNKGKKTGDLIFYDERNFKRWMSQQTKKVETKYYKGLGSSKPEDVPDTFGKKMVNYISDVDSGMHLNKVFHKKFADARKDWLGQYDSQSTVFCLDNMAEHCDMNITDFVNEEMIKFSHADCARSIPSIIDGLKVSQRKILYAAFKRKLKYTGQSLKVAQLGGYTAEHSNYHHGEANLFNTIIGMAQDFVGSNNIPLLYRDGQFGCLDPETEVLMWDGSVKKAKNVRVGDKLIGDNGQPRTVLCMISGIDDMYTVNQGYAKPYKVSSQHILTLRYVPHKTVRHLSPTQIKVKYFDQKPCTKIFTGDTDLYERVHLFLDTISEIDVFDISVHDFLGYSRTEQDDFTSVRNECSINWDHHPTLTSAYDFGLKIKEGVQIPAEYMYSSESARLNLLAGYLDSTYVTINAKSVFITKDMTHQTVFNQILYIVKSLGFDAEISSIQTRITLFIHGDITRIPQKKYSCSNLMDPGMINGKISIVPTGAGPFVGWSVDDNERFLLGDFTVTHNSRISGGDDAASARYIFTKFDALTELIFRTEDEPLLTQVNDDGDLCEPEHYVPIIPMILVNGSIGIGTGWSCKVPCYNPLDVIACVRTWIKNDGEIIIENPDDNTMMCMLPELTPWYMGFKGTIEQSGENRFITQGVVKPGTKSGTIDVTELPIGTWTDDFKTACEELVQTKQIKDLKLYSSPTDVHFTMTPVTNDCTIESLKLYSYLYTGNMVMFTEKNQLHKYNTVDEIVDDFCKVRFDYYIKRKEYQIKILEQELRFLGNKERFITEVVEGTLEVRNIAEEALVSELETRGYDKNPKKEEAEDGGSGSQGYEYLLRLHIRTLTAEKVREIKNDLISTKKRLEALNATSEQTVWLEELNELEIAYKKWISTHASEKKMHKIVEKKTTKVGKK